MKQGRILKLVNNTPYDWVKTSGYSYDVINWVLPDRIEANSQVSVTVEWEPEPVSYKGQDIAETSYDLNTTKDTFRIQAKSDGNMIILLAFCENLVTDRSEKGEIVPLELNPEGCAVFILSGSHDRYCLKEPDDVFCFDESRSYNEKKKGRNGIGLLEAGYNEQNVYWKASTRNICYISGLHFPGDRIWDNCLIRVKGLRNSQKFIIEIQTDGLVTAREEFILRQDEIRVIERKIQKSSSIDVTGQLKTVNFIEAAGMIHVTCRYKQSVRYKSLSVSFRAWEEGINSFHNLYLYGGRLWEKCEIYIQGNEKGSTGCMLTLLTNGEIDENGRLDWLELKGSQTQTCSFPIHRKVPLIAAGYLLLRSGGGTGADITLTGFYIERQQNEKR